MRELINIIAWAVIFSILQEHGISGWELVTVAIQIVTVSLISKIIKLFFD